MTGSNSLLSAVVHISSALISGLAGLQLLGLFAVHKLVLHGEHSQIPQLHVI